MRILAITASALHFQHLLFFGTLPLTCMLDLLVDLDQRLFFTQSQYTRILKVQLIGCPIPLCKYLSYVARLFSPYLGAAHVLTNSPMPQTGCIYLFSSMSMLSRRPAIMAKRESATCALNVVLGLLSPLDAWEPRPTQTMPNTLATLRTEL